MSLLLFGVQCMRCNKLIPASESTQTGTDLSGYMCEICRQAQFRELNNLAAYLEQPNILHAPPLEQRCMGKCNRTLDEIERLTGKRSLFMHWKDNTMLMLCKFCSDAYYVAAREMYRKTAFGAIAKL